MLPTRYGVGSLTPGVKVDPAFVDTEVRPSLHAAYASPNIQPVRGRLTHPRDVIGRLILEDRLAADAKSPIWFNVYVIPHLPTLLYPSQKCPLSSPVRSSLSICSETARAKTIRFTLDRGESASAVHHLQSYLEAYANPSGSDLTAPFRAAAFASFAMRSMMSMAAARRDGASGERPPPPGREG